MIRRACGFHSVHHWVTRLVTCVATVACFMLPFNAASADPVTQYSLSLEQLTKSPSLTLRGVDGRSGIAFGARADQDIKNLTLSLAFTQSPALLQTLSHLNVALNGKFIETIPLSGPSATPQDQAQVDLPVTSLRSFNVIDLQLIGHYTMACEDPLHDDLWIRLDPESKLIFDVTRRVLPDQLGLLPLPFFDASDFQLQPLTFVLGAPSDKRLEAAGIVASWFGALASYRGTKFNVMPQGLPDKGHAIVILAANESLGDVQLPNVQGPTVALLPNPNDPAGKLLIVTGRDDDEIRRAAVTLALGGQTLSGNQALLKDLDVQARKPYDAPNWTPTDRPVSLGELLPVSDLTVTGYDAPAINIPLRLPPDLSSWKTPNALAQLRYRYTPLAKEEDSTLALLINYQFVKEVKLGDANDGIWGELTKTEGVTHRTMRLPLALLESQAELQFKFSYPAPIRSECSGVYMNPRKSSLDPESTLDFSGLPHHMAMPDLAAFRNAAFPFSRMADWSETVVVLSANAQHYEYETFLTVLGKAGQSTGYPATGLRVQRNLDALNHNDILVIDGNSNSPVFEQWAQYFPRPSSSANNDSWSERLWRLFESNRTQTTRPFDAPSSGIYAAGFESPITSGRSVVVLASSNAANLPDGVHEMLFNNAQARNVQGALVTVRADHIETLSGEKSYYIGNLGAYQHTLWFLSTYPLVLLLIFLISAIVIAIVLFLSLRTRAQSRLLTQTSDASSPNHKE